MLIVALVFNPARRFASFGSEKRTYLVWFRGLSDGERSNTFDFISLPAIVMLGEDHSQASSHPQLL